MAEIVRKNVNDVGWTFVLVHICSKNCSTEEREMSDQQEFLHVVDIARNLRIPAI
jgi:hypothetical protein